MKAGQEPPEEFLLDSTDNHPIDVVQKAVEMAGETDEWRYGKNSEGVAAAALYAAYKSERPHDEAGDGRPTQDELADEFNVTTVTLRKRYNELREKLAA